MSSVVGVRELKAEAVQPEADEAYAGDTADEDAKGKNDRHGRVPNWTPNISEARLQFNG